jgi:hypothetical protein
MMILRGIPRNLNWLRAQWFASAYREAQLFLDRQAGDATSASSRSRFSSVQDRSVPRADGALADAAVFWFSNDRKRGG